MDKTWMFKDRASNEYKFGVAQFLEFAFRHASDDDKIFCPCKKCGNGIMQTYEDARVHLICDGFLKGYTRWVCHGEDFEISGPQEAYPSSSSNQQGIERPNFIQDSQDDVQGLIHDIMSSRLVNDILEREENEANEVPEHRSTNSDQIDTGIDSNFSAVMKDLNTELYPGCSKYSKLSYLLHLYHLKCLNGWSQKSFSMLLELQNKAFPEGVSLPRSFYEAKKIIRTLGLDYDKYNACINDCSLFWGDKLNDELCRNCGIPWWKVYSTEGNIDDSQNVLSNCVKKKPAKVLRYFPIIPRLKRLFSTEKTAIDVRWHDEGRKKDGLLRHPADGLAWKEFDSRYPGFASDSRNLRLALATDGFNPFKTMSTNYSTWPVVLVIYNFPPWVCMKQSAFMLTMIIPGEKSPGNDIDIYFPPLIAELRQLWEGVEVYDASRKEIFKLRAALTSMIHDFPAYANMSGWSTKGQFACPCCMDSTDGLWLKHSRKWSYMGHRRWLPLDHQTRSQNQLFNGKSENRMTPSRLTGNYIVTQLVDVETNFGKAKIKSRKRDRKMDGDESEESYRAKSWWKKKSIFFELPYWEHNLLRHNLDVMHIEKNVCDNIIETLLGTKKSKDNLKARLDLVNLGIREQLHPTVLNDDKRKLPPSCLTLSKDEKDVLLRVLRDVKTPDGYSSNISRCVNLKQRKISGLKSHDCHVLIEDLLPVALRSCGIYYEGFLCLKELSNFFKIICSKVLDLKELDKLQDRVILTLCRMEILFLPSFFTIMVHLIIHLVEEAKLGGPVHYRWMYPFERYFVKLKSFVKNTACPEGCIAEGYIADECLTFCSRYFGEVETVFNRPLRNPEPPPSNVKYLFSTGGYPIGAIDHYELSEIEIIQIQRYVIRHCDGVERFKTEFIEMEKKKRRRSSRLTEREKIRLLNDEFPAWFTKKMLKANDPSITEDIINLSIGPNNIAKKLNGFVINGIRFHTVHREVNRKTQNSGVVNYCEESGLNYYEKIKEIIEVDYHGCFKVVLFKCDWVDVHHDSAIKQDMGFTTVNFSRLIHNGDMVADDPFVFSSQVQQVFYVADPNNVNWFTVVKVRPRDRYDMVEREITDNFIDITTESLDTTHEKDVPQWVRTDIDAEIVEN